MDYNPGVLDKHYLNESGPFRQMGWLQGALGVHTVYFWMAVEVNALNNALKYACVSMAVKLFIYKDTTCAYFWCNMFGRNGLYMWNTSVNSQIWQGLNIYIYILFIFQFWKDILYTKYPIGS